MPVAPPSQSSTGREHHERGQQMLRKINDLLLRAWVRVRDEAGQAMPEYGLLVALIAVVAIVATTAVGLAVSGKFQDIADAIGGAGGGS